MDMNGSEFNEELNLLKSPPDFEFAENHCNAQIIHKEVIRNSKRCPCCNEPISKIKYSLLTDITELASQSTAYKYFLLLKNQFILLSINFIVAGIYNMIQNYKGDSCNKDKNCSQNLNNYLSILNRMDSYYFEDYILDTLYLVSFLIQLGFLRYISYSENNDYTIDRGIDGEFTISKCSIHMNNIYNHERLGNYQINDVKQLNIIDCCLIYNKEYLENQLKLKIKGILAQNNDISLKNVIHRIVDQIFILQNQKGFLSCTGRGFITFSNEKEAIKYKKKKKWLVCPRPSNENWNIINLQVNLKPLILNLVIGQALLYLVIYVKILQTSYNLANSGNQLNLNTLLSLSMAVFISISIKLSAYLTIRGFELVFSNTIITEFQNCLLVMFESLELLYSALIAHIHSFSYDEIDQSESKQQIWNAGGLNEDIIFIVLINGFQIMIFSIIDLQYAWQLIQLIYYKYLNKNSTLTQFEANQLTQKKINFNDKYISVYIFICYCSQYGYMYPILYPITLIALLIIYWMDKYQLINHGVREDIKLDKFILRIPILLLIMLQLSSTQLHNYLLKISMFTHPLMLIMYILYILLIYIFFFTNWIFKDQSLNLKTNKDLMKSLEHNDLYSKYNPIIDDTLSLNPVFEEENIQQLKFSRQAKFYNKLQVKLLREIEKELQQVLQNQINQNSISRAKIYPSQNEQT